jgi:hypothetical protein
MKKRLAATDGTKFCPKCGECIGRGQKHKCEPGLINPDGIGFRESQLVAALVNAEAIIAGTHDDPQRGRSKMLRALNMYALTEDHRFLYMLQTSAELPSCDDDWTK